MGPAHHSRCDVRRGEGRVIFQRQQRQEIEMQHRDQRVLGQMQENVNSALLCVQRFSALPCACRYDESETAGLFLVFITCTDIGNGVGKNSTTHSIRAIVYRLHGQARSLCRSRPSRHETWSLVVLQHYSRMAASYSRISSVSPT